MSIQWWWISAASMELPYIISLRDKVYGRVPIGCSGLITEETLIHTSSLYSSYKDIADLLVIEYYRTYGFSVKVSRCVNNYASYHYYHLPVVAQTRKWSSYIITWRPKKRGYYNWEQVFGTIRTAQFRKSNRFIMLVQVQR